MSTAHEGQFSLKRTRNAIFPLLSMNICKLEPPPRVESRKP
nr:MAG TPA: hypothetical protein [Caudoviricetes sp.]